ncbi:LPXTG-motif cell wall-anchored protein [Actinoplanes lutulentus]|uniref:LPXTG-motif cell wall-anchored protein n=1 Tax=Actinoplanes lutulentus TaxID=1287878 RepID=A0A327Z8T1_9ACTN|nr:LPXTG cell wall anchor domain-containing protein [Actinoplanes lutulentus]MBB2944812.1 LPXTG-motif cell wall-anchored protein [Actinoplanes lutulentus]RAK35395.1 LPXTG-motif cell wall-anchored protein [Actinoplanes lutulentus]
MRRMILAGGVVALALLIPAAPATAQAATPGLDAACQTVERKLFKDIRELITIDLETATDVEIRVVANRILAAAKTDSLPVLPGAIQDRLDGTADDLRAFLKKGVQTAWTVALRISVNRTMTDAGANVQAAAQKVLGNGTIDAFLTYLNEDLYTARALDCASQPTPTASASPSTTPSATPSTSPSATASTSPSATTTATPAATPSASTDAPAGEDGEDGGLPVTGTDTGTMAGVGGALLLLGGAGYLIGRRRRSRFVA